MSTTTDLYFFDPNHTRDDEVALPGNGFQNLKDIYGAHEQAKKKFTADLREFMTKYKIEDENHLTRYRRHICYKIFADFHLNAEQRRCFFACIQPRGSTEPLPMNKSDRKLRRQAQQILSRKWSDLVSRAFQKVFSWFIFVFALLPFNISSPMYFHVQVKRNTLRDVIEYTVNQELHATEHPTGAQMYDMMVDRFKPLKVDKVGPTVFSINLFKQLNFLSIFMLRPFVRSTTPAFKVQEPRRYFPKDRW